MKSSSEVCTSSSTDSSSDPSEACASRSMNRETDGDRCLRRDDPRPLAFLAWEASPGEEEVTVDEVDEVEDSRLVGVSLVTTLSPREVGFFRRWDGCFGTGAGSRSSYDTLRFASRDEGATAESWETASVTGFSTFPWGDGR